MDDLKNADISKSRLRAWPVPYLGVLAFAPIIIGFMIHRTSMDHFQQLEIEQHKLDDVFLRSQTVLSVVFALVIAILFFQLQKTNLSLERLSGALEGEIKTRTEELQTALDQVSIHQAFNAHNEKMIALCEMAAGLAHEINTPLATISLTAELLAQEAVKKNDPKFIAGLTTISTVVERVAKIVKDLQGFPRTDAGHVHLDRK